MVEASIGSLHFAPGDTKTIPEIGISDIVDEDSRVGEDDIGTQF